MSLYCDTGSVETDLSLRQLHDLLLESLAKLAAHTAKASCRYWIPAQNPLTLAHRRKQRESGVCGAGKIEPSRTDDLLRVSL